MKNIVVFGGTGFVGRSVCEQLVRRRCDGRIVVPTRRLRHGRDIQFLPTLQLAQADVHDDAALRQVLAGADAAINLIAVLHGNATRFDEVHVQFPKRLAAACQASGVRRLLHVSALGVGPQAPSNYLLSKAAGEAVLQQSGLELTLLRPSVIFGAEDRFTNLFAAMQAWLPVIPLAGAAAQFQPVWVEDVARALVTALDRPETVGQTYECAGPTRYTLAELVRLCGRLAGHPRPVLPLPDALARLQALLMRLWPGEPLMSADNLDSMKVPNVASGSLLGLDALGIEAAALQAVGPEWLAPGRGPARLGPWRAHARR